MEKIFNLKLLLFFIIIINIALPINNLFSFTVFFISFILIFFNKIKLITKKNYYFLVIIFLLTSINIFFIKNKYIEEAHSAFITSTDLNLISKFLPKQLMNNLSHDLKKFDWDRYWDGRQANTKNKLFIKNPYAFSVDSFFQKNKYSRQILNINFNKRSDHRIGHFNTKPFRMPYDQDLKENFPFYVFYEMNKNFQGSEICGKGKLFISSSDKNNFKEKKFKTFGNKYECITLTNNTNYYIFAYSIGDYDNFEIKLKTNKNIKFNNFLKLIIILSIILIIFIHFIEIKSNKNLTLIFISFLSSLILAYFNDPNILFGLRHAYGGSDGLIFNSFASDIVQNLKNYNFLLALRGEEDVFYFQPGMRYYISIFKIIFGETNFGYIFLVSFLPYLIYLLFIQITKKNIAYILFILFIFFPIFESIGFGHFNYVRQAIRLHAESLSIMFLILTIYLIFLEEKNKKRSNTYLIIIALLFSQVIFLRPNFLPTCFILSIYLIFSNILNKDIWVKNLLFCIALSPTFLCLIHNLYFADQFILFSSASRHILFSKDFVEFNFTEANNFLHLIIIQLRDWNDFVYFPRLLILIYVIYNIKNYKFSELIFYLIICCFTQHILLLLTHASSRYAYFAWLLTFILFIKILYDLDHLNKLLNYLKNKRLFT